MKLKSGFLRLGTMGIISFSIPSIVGSVVAFNYEKHQTTQASKIETNKLLDQDIEYIKNKTNEIDKTAETLSVELWSNLRWAINSLVQDGINTIPKTKIDWIDPIPFATFNGNVEIIENNTGTINMDDFEISQIYPSNLNEENGIKPVIQLMGSINISLWYEFTARIRINTGGGRHETISPKTDGKQFLTDRIVSWSLAYDTVGDAAVFKLALPQYAAIRHPDYDGEYFPSEIETNDLYTINVGGEQLRNIVAQSHFEEQLAVNQEYHDLIQNLINDPAVSAFPYFHVVNWVDTDDIITRTEKREFTVEELVPGILEKSFDDSWTNAFFTSTQTISHSKITQIEYYSPITGIKSHPYGDNNFLDIMLGFVSNKTKDTIKLLGTELREDTVVKEDNYSFWDTLVNLFKSNPLSALSSSIGLIKTALGLFS